jgi:hypothetical protein
VLAVGDGALAFWSALREVFPEIKEGRCWLRKTAGVGQMLAFTWFRQAGGVKSNGPPRGGTTAL